MTRYLSVLLTGLLLMAAPALAQTIKIGVIAPLTGGGAAWGTAMAEGVRFAIEDANRTGGINVNGAMRQVELVAYDDQYKASEAIAAYNRLLTRDGVKYIFVLTSAGTLALKETVGSDDVLVLTGAYSSKAIDAETKHIVRLLSTPKEYVPSVVRWVRNNIGGDRVAILNPNDETGWDLSNVAAAAWQQNGYAVVARELTERTQKDFQPVLTG